jgi:hypothetical protein
MSFEQLSYLAQIVASVGVIVSLIFVGLQIKHNTGALGTARGGTWWRSAKRTRFVPGFLLDVDAVLAKNRGVSVVVNEATHDS